MKLTPTLILLGKSLDPETSHSTKVTQSIKKVPKFSEGKISSWISALKKIPVKFFSYTSVCL